LEEQPKISLNTNGKEKMKVYCNYSISSLKLLVFAIRPPVPVKGETLAVGEKPEAVYITRDEYK